MSTTHVIDGVTYVEVDRQAEVGDKIYSDRSGDTYTVQSVNETTAVITKPGQLGHINGFYHGTYTVLEPLETEETPSVAGLLANLARRVSSLEQQLRDTQGNVERLAEELATETHQSAPKEVEVVTFEKFLDSIADKVAERLVGQR